jgi:hypothetical protein
MKALSRLALVVWAAALLPAQQVDTDFLTSDQNEVSRFSG